MDNLLPTLAGSNPTERNIAAIAKLKHDALGRLTPTEPVSELATKLVGNMGFLVVQLMLISGWILVDLHVIRGRNALDPFRFGVLALIVSSEGVFLTVFVRITQSRMARPSDRSSHLGLQVNLSQEKTMRLNVRGTSALTRVGLLVLVSAAWQSHAHAQAAKAPYPSMAPLDQYLMEPNAEIALARSAAPESISRDAEILVLGRHGYEGAGKGKNGFVCIVERSWTAGIDDPDFWNPKLRGAICFNAPAARTYLPITIKKTELVLAGRSKAQMFEGIKIAFDKKELRPLEAGAMCYMMSKESYLSDHDGHWHPHLMFFVPRTDSAAWGANLPGSPILGSETAEDRLTIFMVPVANWSDGTPDSTSDH